MLYIMRHGKTDWNEKSLLQGRTDIPLNEEGIKMAEKAYENYKDVHFDICFCSPLIRAKETARIVLGNRNTPVEYDDRLVEMSFGICEGEPYSFKEPVGAMSEFFIHPENYDGVPEGESTADLFERTGSFLNEKVYPLLEEGKDVLIVGHGAMNSAIVCQVNGIPVKDFWSTGIENCKLIKLNKYM